jgi:hypothetical protein
VATTTISRMLARKRSLMDNCGTQCVAVTHMNADFFRVRAQPLLGKASERGNWSLCRVAYVCHCAGWLADSLADSDHPAGMTANSLTPAVDGCAHQWVPDARPRTRESYVRLRAPVARCT